MRKNIFVYQQEENDCGVAALSMILRYFGSIYPLRKLRNMIDADSGEVSALQISDTATKLGLQVDSYFCDYRFLVEEETPQIVSISKQNLFEHYYVVLSANEKKIKIADPPVGIKTISRDQFEQEWTGFLMCFKPTNTYSKVKIKENELKAYFRLLFDNHKLIIFSILLAMLSSVIGITTAIFIETSINYLIPRQSINIVLYFCFGIVGAYIFKMAVDYYRNIISILIRNKLMYEIDSNYFRYLMDVKLNFYSLRKTGDILSRFTDSSKIVDCLSNIIIAFSLDMIMMIVSLIFMFNQNYILASLSLISLPIYFFVILSFKDIYNYSNFDQLEKGADLNSEIIEDVKGIESIKSLRAENITINKMIDKLGKYIYSSARTSKISIIQKVIKDFIQSSFVVVILGLGVVLVIENKDNIGSLMSMLFLLSYLLSSKYKDNQVLYDVNLFMPMGETIGISGKSGSGKSTLAKIIVKFLDADDGEILLGDYSIDRLSPKDVRSYISYIPQNAHLFSGTVRDNLTIGNPDKISDEEIVLVCEKIGIMDKIDQMDFGLDTVIEEGANQFSGGQQQKLMIARAILADTKIIILDEATSGIDDIGVHKIISEMRKLGRTMIFITHQSRVLNEMDKVYEISDGHLSLVRK